MKLKITIVSDSDSWINRYVEDLVRHWSSTHEVRLVHEVSAIQIGDLAFFLSFGRKVPVEVLAGHKHNLVVHASDLPRGRGWSPLTWQILEGKNRFPITLFEAADENR